MALSAGYFHMVYLCNIWAFSLAAVCESVSVRTRCQALVSFLISLAMAKGNPMARDIKCSQGQTAKPQMAASSSLYCPRQIKDLQLIYGTAMELSYEVIKELICEAKELSCEAKA